MKNQNSIQKYLFISMVFILLVALMVGCASEQPAAEQPAAEQPAAEEPAAEEPAAEEPAAEEPAAEGRPLMAMSNAEMVNAWRVTFQNDFEAQAEAYGFDLISIDANQDVSKQLTDVEQMLAQKPAIMVVSPLETEASAPIVELCEKAGVPLIVVDRVIAATPGEGVYKALIVQDHRVSGRALANKAVELLTEKYGEPRGNVVHVQGMAGAGPVIEANEGWDEVMADYPDIVTVFTSDGGFTKAGGLEVMEDALQAYDVGEIDIVRSDYSDMTMGALDAIKNAGRTELLGYVLGEGGHIKALEAVVAGDIAMETQTPPYSAKPAMETALKILAGEPYDVFQDVPILIFESNKAEEAQAYIDLITEKGFEF